MNRQKPLIGITGPEKGGTSAWIFTAMAVRLQGGKPVRITPGKPVAAATLDGLILGGGADINPERYGELLEKAMQDKPKPKGLRAWLVKIVSILFYPVIFVLRNIFSTKSPEPGAARDELEFELLQQACKRKIPVLGICRGAQLINVQFGGTLHQDVGAFYTEVPRVHTIWPRKTVSINPESRLHKIVETDGAWVNALHHQAVDKLGEELKIAARDQADIIQAIEHPGYPYLLGVQWHPEYLPQIRIQRKIFKELVVQAVNVRRKM